VLRAEHVSKTWDPDGPAPVRAVQDVSLAVAVGETVAIRGPSGSGKTTLLSILGGLLRPDVGRVWLDGCDLAAASEPERAHVRLTRIGFVFQRGLLLPTLTARENVALVPRVAGASTAEAGVRADALLAELGLAARAHLLPAALSAGECQRAALARALVMRPELVLADEPTAHLDQALGAQVMHALKSLATAGRAALVVVTHDPRAAAVADRVLELSDGRLLSA
jgi:putative ABC transport system ATP-binding protein